MENYNEIQLTKNKMDLNNRKMKNHPPSSALLKWEKKLFEFEECKQKILKMERSEVSTK